MMEDIPFETYSLLIDTYIKDAVRRECLFDTIVNIPCIEQGAAVADSSTPVL
jgi:hypothetical protein